MNNLTLTASDGARLACYVWPVDDPNGVIHIAHGMGEHARRYDRVARALNTAGYEVIACDQRGHGATAQALLGDLGGDGWNRLVADAYEVNRHIALLHPKVPIVLLGHSMGAMMAQLYITRYGQSIDALVLSGSPGFKTPLSHFLSRQIAQFEVWRVGWNQHSALLQRLLFADSNKAFSAPHANGFEWLSRDAGAVQKYIDDPDCGFVLTAGSLLDLVVSLEKNQCTQVLLKIPKALPIYVFSGTEDPVHGGRKDLNRMLSAFEQQGLMSVDVNWYAAGRHEMFNELNAEEVIADLVGWLNRLHSTHD